MDRSQAISALKLALGMTTAKATFGWIAQSLGGRARLRAGFAPRALAVSPQSGEHPITELRAEFSYPS